MARADLYLPLLLKVYFPRPQELVRYRTMNSDGNVDFLGQSTIFFGDGSGGILYTQPRINSIKVADGIAVDFDHNGTTDFVQSQGGAPGIHYYPGNGHGGFGDPITISTSVFSIIATADFNGDGFPDLVLQDGLNPANISVFLNPGTTPVSIAAASQMQISASAATASTVAPVTLIANVSSLNAGSPSGVGTVTFTEGSTTLGTATVDIYGNAALDFTFAAGLHNVNASFAGVLDPSTNTLFAPSASFSSVAVAVNPGPPAGAVPNITLTTSVSPVRQLNPVTFMPMSRPALPQPVLPEAASYLRPMEMFWAPLLCWEQQRGCQLMPLARLSFPPWVFTTSRPPMAEMHRFLLQPPPLWLKTYVLLPRCEHPALFI